MRAHRHLTARRAVIASACLALAVAGSGLAHAASQVTAAKTALRVTYWPHGQDQPVKRVWTLTCAPASGTHPEPGLSCLELLRHPGALAPVTKPCTLLLPRGTAASLVQGLYRGRKVDRLFRPGCDALWRPLHALLTGR